ncbi:MAG: hypothetical protein EOP49_50045, partial [Sphingobacteriales bacterium]
LDMLGVFAEFETNIRKERQLEGIAKAKAEGVYTGRKATIDGAKINALVAAGKGIALAFPTPGSVSIKYSAAIRFCGAGEAVV